MSVQSLNGDSYQGAQVGANVQSQVGTQPMCRQVNALESRSRQSDWHFRFCPDRKRQRDVETKPYQQPNQNKDNQEVINIFFFFSPLIFLAYFLLFYSVNSGN